MHSRKRTLIKALNQWQLYVLLIPAFLLLFAFSYLPIGGIIIAFKDFNFRDGIFGSPWMDPLFHNFQFVINNSLAWRAIRNTVLLNLLFISVGTMFAVFLSIMLNEIRNKAYKKIAQSLSFLPFFISWIVVGLFATSLLGFETGVVNRLLTFLGFEKVMFYNRPDLWPWILLFFAIWKSSGYSAVIYLATISGFSAEYYEAAAIDGATRWQMARYLTIPLLKPTIIILLILSLGGIMRADFGLFYFVTSDVPLLYSTTDVLDTFIFRALRVTGNIGMSSAASFFQSVVSFLFVITFNWLANKAEKGSGLF